MPDFVVPEYEMFRPADHYDDLDLFVELDNGEWLPITTTICPLCKERANPQWDDCQSCGGPKHFLYLHELPVGTHVFLP